MTLHAPYQKNNNPQNHFNMKKFNKPILAFLTFIFVQLIVSFVIGIIMVASNPEIMKSAMAETILPFRAHYPTPAC